MIEGTRMTFGYLYDHRRKNVGPAVSVVRCGRMRVPVQSISLATIPHRTLLFHDRCQPGTSLTLGKSFDK